MILRNDDRGNTTTWVIVGAVILVLGGLFALPRLNRSSVTTSVPCLIPNLPLVLHIHPELEIEVNGVKEFIPDDVGISGICERAIHTHDSTGQIHVEAQAVRDYILQDFFDVWAKKIDREGYEVRMTVDETDSTEYGKLLLKDGQKIKLSYSKK